MRYWRLLRASSAHWVGDLPDEDANGRHLHLVLTGPSAANTLGAEVLFELEALSGTLRAAKGVEALFLWGGHPEHFIAGADIREIESIETAQQGAEKARLGQRILGVFATLHYPSFAMIHGTCLGGGLELALVLRYRIAAADARVRIGLPEVQLGIIPGFGGTQRLPKLVGLEVAIEAILAGKRYPATVAHRKGIVDILVPPEGFRLGAMRAALAVLENGGREVERRRRRLRGGSRRWLMERNPFGRALLRRAVRMRVARETSGHYPAPPAALTAIFDGSSLALAEGMQLESRLCGELIAGETSKNLIRVFHLTEAARRLSIPCDDPRALVPACPQVGVLGAGVMGAGIAALLLENGVGTRIRDLSAQALQRGLGQIGAELRAWAGGRRLAAHEVDQLHSGLTHATQLVGFGRADIVIEAIVERLDVKRRALAEIEPQLAPDAVVASNTSALSITALQDGARVPERVVGMHFFNPVGKMPLVEIIPGAQTAAWAVARAVSIAQRLGKYPVVVRDAPGFLVNRLLFPYLDSACRLLGRGIAGERIDDAAKRFGLPMGPFRLLDEVGLDIAVEVSETLHRAFGERARPAPMLAQLHAQGLLGRKGGIGFYRYEGGRRKEWNAGVSERAAAPTGANAALAEGEIIQFLLDRMIDEAARILEEGVVASPSDIDLAMIMGAGFPPFLGGPLCYADRAGIDRIVGRLSERAAQGEAPPPCARLEKMAREANTFHRVAGKGATTRQDHGLQPTSPV